MQGVDREELGISFFTKDFACTYDFKGKKTNKPWLAKIAGIDPKWGFRREFEKTNYTKPEKYPDLEGLYWKLEKNVVYEYRNFMADHLTNFTVEGFFTVRHDGIYDLEKEEVRVVLGMPVKKKKIEVDINKCVDDDIPF